MNLTFLQDKAPPVAPDVLDWSGLETVFEGAPGRICYHGFRSALWKTKASEISGVSPLVVSGTDETQGGQKESSIITEIFLVSNQTLGETRDWSCHFFVSESSVV